MKKALIIIAKQPLAGQVKTRIGATLGAELAAALYRAALEDTIELAAGYREAQPVLSYAPDTAAAFDFFTGLAPGFLLLPQRGADLGERLWSAFEQSAQRGMEAMVLLGSDNPSVPRSRIDQAFAALDDPRIDAVLGPADDGGYYLIGMRRPHAPLFQRIAWSTEVVAGQTRERAAQAGLRLAEIAGWYDLDTAHDLDVLRRDLAAHADGRAPRTRAFVEAIGDRLASAAAKPAA